jgi:basic membrane protein A
LNVRTFERPAVLPGARGLLVLGLLAFLLNGCSLTGLDCRRPEVFCAGLVTDTGGLGDYGLTQSAWDELRRAQTDGVIGYAAYIESVDARDYIKNIELFARQGYDVVISAGPGLRDDTQQGADRYPATVFIGLDQPPDESRPNFIALTFPEDRAGFLAGVLAAQMTETNVIGAVCETSGIPANWRACEGFDAGARHENPQVKALVVYRDNGSQETLFRDADWGRSTSLDLIRDGADVIFGVGGGTGGGALAAAAEAGAYAIGSEQDQFHVTRAAQAVLLTSLVKHAGPAVYDLVLTIHNGLPYPAEIQGRIEIASFHLLEQQIPGQIQTGLFDLKAQLEQGSVQTGVPAQAPK